MSSAIALAAAAAFNLVCTAVPEGGPARAKPIVETFRVDLERDLWCKGACKTVLPTVHIGPHAVGFGPEGFPEYPPETSAAVNVEHGYFVLETRAGGVLTLAMGSCKWRKFTGFP